MGRLNVLPCKRFAVYFFMYFREVMIGDALHFLGGFEETVQEPKMHCLGTRRQLSRKSREGRREGHL